MEPADEPLPAPLSHVTLTGLGHSNFNSGRRGPSDCRAALRAWPASPRGARLSVPGPAASAASLPALRSPWPTLGGFHQLHPEIPSPCCPTPPTRDWLQKYVGPQREMKTCSRGRRGFEMETVEHRPSAGPSECWVLCHCTGPTPVKCTRLPHRPPAPSPVPVVAETPCAEPMASFLTGPLGRPLGSGEGR